MEGCQHWQHCVEHAGSHAHHCGLSRVPLGIRGVCLDPHHLRCFRGLGCVGKPAPWLCAVGCVGWLASANTALANSSSVVYESRPVKCCDLGCMGLHG